MLTAASQADEGALLSDPLLQRLFRLFMLFSDITEIGQQRITPEQTHFLINNFFRVSRPDQYQCSIPTITCSETVSFRDLIHICDLLFPNRKHLEPIVDRVFERFVSQVIYKGFVMCRRGTRTSGCIQRDRKWRTYWCTLSPGAIYLWPLHKATTASNRKLITLDHGSTILMGSFDEERFTWQLTCAKSKFIFGDFDELRRTHWIHEMQLATDRRTKAELLEYDRNCSKKAENLTPSEKNLSWRLALESENARLMQLLDDERRALHDEEIVRTLAARMLDEEREMREKLEKRVKSLESRLAEQTRNEANLVENDKENRKRLDEERTNGCMKVCAQSL
uniref:PH domain-containing protein n=1 Tax=Parascaris univalens TaxID=6257 RepID=A0A915AHD7_PARUN